MKLTLLSGDTATQAQADRIVIELDGGQVLELDAAKGPGETGVVLSCPADPEAAHCDTLSFHPGASNVTRVEITRRSKS